MRGGLPRLPSQPCLVASLQVEERLWHRLLPGTWPRRSCNQGVTATFTVTDSETAVQAAPGGFC